MRLRLCSDANAGSSPRFALIALFALAEQERQADEKKSKEENDLPKVAGHQGQSAASEFASARERERERVRRVGSCARLESTGQEYQSNGVQWNPTESN